MNAGLSVETAAVNKANISFKLQTDIPLVLHNTVWLLPKPQYQTTGDTETYYIVLLGFPSVSIKKMRKTKMRCV
jgi:hypothetical protein